MPRPFALIRTNDQWSRVAHHNTALDNEVVSLAWNHEAGANALDTPSPVGAGLAFDGHCRLYHSVPDEGRVERILWAGEDPLHPLPFSPLPLDLFEPALEAPLGDFTAVAEHTGALSEPRGLAVDEEERLFIAESGTRRILIYDLWSRRLLRRAPIGGHPLDLVATGRTVFVLQSSPPGLLRLEARRGPWAVPLSTELSDPSRLALTPAGEIFVLDNAGTPEARVVPLHQPDRALEVAHATAIAFQPREVIPVTALNVAASPTSADPETVLVVARRPNEDFLRFRISATQMAEIQPLKGREYDGRGIICTPDGRIGFWTLRGFRHAVAARLRYLPHGRVTSFRLDSGEFHTSWGKLFLDACIPKDTTVRVHCMAIDEPPEEATLQREPPVNITHLTVPRPELSPPMPPLSLVPQEVEVRHSLHRRETGHELPWIQRSEDDSFETYEAPILADAGRYLWVTLELRGNTRSTPRIRALRAEYPAHDYLRRLPKIFSRDEHVASFLQRYLALFEGVFSELDGKAEARRALVDARSAAAEILPWLASFLGLVFDERWPVTTRRIAIAEATWLFRFRGTIPGLTRFLEIYTGARIIIIEKFRVRGLGGAILGDPTGLTSSSVLGAGFRVGGAVGEAETLTLTGSVEDAFDTHAHRFSVIIPAALTTEQLEVVRHILDLHRPAHTLVDVCTIGAGMRVGRGLHVELTSIIGRGGGFLPLQLGNSFLGREAIIGRPEPGARLGSSRLGEDSRIG